MLQLPEVVEFLGLDRQPEVSGESDDYDDPMDVDSVNRSGKFQHSSFMFPDSNQILCTLVQSEQRCPESFQMRPRISI